MNSLQTPTSKRHTRDTYWYLHVGNARDLTGIDHILYRLFEMLPGILSFATIGTFIALSFLKPVWAAYLTIAFSIYWLFKTMYLSVHLRHNFRRMRHNMTVDWNARIAEIPGGTERARAIEHIVIFPFYQEGYEVVAESMRALLDSGWDTSRLIVVLAAEERAGEAARATAGRIQKEFQPRFKHFLATTHPKHLPHEIPGKGSNISYAAEEVRKQVLEPQQIPYERVLVSAFDVDTVVCKGYFACLTYYFLTAPSPMRSSFQPVPLYNNNIWRAPILSRVMAYTSSFWQMIQQERPEKLATFSSHAVPFQPLYEAGYWQRNVVSEDSRIFWNLFVRYDGDYRVIPLAYPVSMDANAGASFWGTVRNIYKQHRRWTYGAENVAYILFTFMHNKKIRFGKKLGAALVQIEGFWSLTTHPLILFFIGWMPLFFGGRIFNTTVLSYNLPLIARGFLTAAMFGLIVSAVIAMRLVPHRPKEMRHWHSVIFVLQWILVPFTMIVFSSIPGLDSQLRLLTGRYLSFWVTPKHRE